MEDRIQKQLEKLLILALESEISQKQIERLNGLLEGYHERILFTLNFLELVSDLKRLEKVAGFEITSLHSRCVLIEKADMTITNKVDVFVLVDGDTRVKQLGFNRNSQMLEIDISLNENDRFLTLIAADGGDDIIYPGGLWYFWTKPTIPDITAGPLPATDEGCCVETL